MPVAAYGSRAELTALDFVELSPHCEADDRPNAGVWPLGSRSFGSPDVSAAWDSAGQADERPVVVASEEFEHSDDPKADSR